MTSENRAFPGLAVSNKLPAANQRSAKTTTLESDKRSADEKVPSPDEKKALPLDEKKPPQEFGGPRGPEPTRFGDWERNGRCTDF